MNITKDQKRIAIAIAALVAAVLMFMVVASVNKPNASTLGESAVQNNDTNNVADTAVLGDGATMTKKDIETGDIGGDANIQ